MFAKRPDPRPSEDGGSVPAIGNLPWVDPYTDEVLAQMRAQAPLSAVVGKLRALANSSFIGSAINTTTNSATVYWHGPRPAAVNTVVSDALTADITVNVIEAPFSADELMHSRSQIRARIRELDISAVVFDTDGRGSTVHFRTMAAVQAAKEALANYQGQLDQVVGGDGAEPAIAALYSLPGSPAIRISEQPRNPQNWAARGRGPATDDSPERTSPA